MDPPKIIMAIILIAVILIHEQNAIYWLAVHIINFIKAIIMPYSSVIHIKVG